MHTNKETVALVLCATSVLLPAPAHAQILDAFYNPTSNGASSLVGTYQAAAQTFAVVNSGFITRVDVLINNRNASAAPLTLDIRQLNGSLPTEPNAGTNILGSSALTPVTGIPDQWIAFNLSPIPVFAGERLALVLTTTSIADYYWNSDYDWPFNRVAAGTYPDGQAFNRGSWATRAPGDPTPSSQWGNSFLSNSQTTTTGGGPNVDMGFRIYVSPVPKPVMSLRVSEVEVCWTSETNTTYRVDYRSELTTNAWVTLRWCVASTGSETCVTDKVVKSEPRRFYRVVATNCVPGL